MSEQISPPRGVNGRGPMPWPLRILGGFAVFVITFLTVGSVLDVFRTEGKPLNTLNPEGPLAQSIQDLVVPVFLIAGVVYVLVLVGTLVVTRVFREKPDDDDQEFVHQLEGHTTAEIAWTAIPAIILAVVGVLSVINLQSLQPDLAAKDVLRVQVEGQQWWWSFRYDMGEGTENANLYTPGGELDATSTTAPNGSFDDTSDVNTATELVIPTGVEVQLKVTSNDVIHSFWIPSLNGKKDAVPGMENDWKIQADKPGVYLGQCTEFCGLSHANMRMLVRAVSPDEFRAWVENQRKPAATIPADNLDAIAGREYFKSAACSQCHLIRGLTDESVADPETGVATQLVSGNAPELTHLMSRGMFAGAIFNLTLPDPDPACEKRNADRRAGGTEAGLEDCDDPANNSNPGNPNNPLNRPALEAWLRNPPGVKPMCVAPVASHTCDPETAEAQGELDEDADLRVRGMKNFGLTEAQIDQLVAYLETLK